ISGEGCEQTKGPRGPTPGPSLTALALRYHAPRPEADDSDAKPSAGNHRAGPGEQGVGARSGTRRDRSDCDARGGHGAEAGFDPPDPSAGGGFAGAEPLDPSEAGAGVPSGVPSAVAVLVFALALALAAAAAAALVFDSGTNFSAT